MTETINPQVRDETVSGAHPRMRGGVSYLGSASTPAVIEVKRPLVPRLVGWGAMAITAIWVAMIIYTVSAQGMADGTSIMGLANQAGAMLAPLAVVWLVALFVQRNADQRAVTDALRKTSAQVTMPIDKAEARLQAITEAMDRQVKMLGDATNLAIGRIDQARQSLRHETEALTAVSARSAGEIDRVGSFLREQTVGVDKAIDALREQAGKTENQAGEIFTALESRTAGLESRVGDMAENLASSAERFGMRVEEVRDSSAARFDHMSEVSQSIIDGLSQAESALGSRLEDYRNLSENAGTLAETLATPLAQNADLLRVAAIKSAKAMRAATELMGRQLTSYEEAQSKATETTKEFARRVEGQADRVLEVIEVAKASSAEIDNVANDRVSAIQQFSQNLADKVARIREDVDAAGTSLREAATQSLTEVGETVAEKFVAMRAEVNGTTDNLTRAAETAKALTDNLNVATTTLDNAIAGTDEKVVSLMALDRQLNERVDDLRALDEMLVEQIENITSTGKSTQSTTNEINNRINESMDSVEKIMAAASETLDRLLSSSREVGGQFHNEIGKLTSSTDQALSRLENARDVLNYEAGAIAKAANDAATTVDEATSGVSNAILEAANDAVSAVDASANNVSESFIRSAEKATGLVQEASNDSAQKLGDAAVDMVHKITAANTQLDEQSGKIMAVAEQAAEQVDRASARVGHELESLQATAADTEARVDRVGEKMSQQIGDLKVMVDRSVKEMSTTMAAFEARGGSLSDLLKTNKQSLDAVSSRLQTVVADADELIAQSSERVSGLGVDFAGKISEIQNASEMANDRLVAIAGEFENRLRGLSNKPEEMIEQIQAVSGELGDQLDDLDTMVERTGDRVASLNKGLQSNFAGLTNIISETVEEFGAVETRLRGHIEGLGKQASGDTEDVRKLGKMLESEISNLSTMTESASKQLKDAMMEMRSDMDNVIEQTAEQLSKVDGVRTSLSGEADKFTNATETVFIRIGQIEGKMVEQRANFAAGYDATLNRLEDSTISLGIRLQELGDRTDKVVKSLEGASSNISQHASTLVEAADEASTKSTGVSDVFRRHAEALSTAADKASQQAQVIREKDMEARRDAFLSAAKFVIESLHSISVDFVRMLDGEAPERLWKAFSAGDTSVFTRRLVSTKDRVAVDKIKAMYQENSEFRLYVQRYVRQFEEVFSQALGTDHGDLLSSTFMTSDIGKLYLALCQGIDRQPLSNTDFEQMPAQGEA